MPVYNRKNIDSKIVYKLDRITDIIIDLEDLIEIGSEITETVSSINKIQMINGNKRETKAGISARLFSNDKFNVSLSMKREKRKQNQREFYAEKRNIYRLDINLIRSKIQEIFKEIGYSVVYICLDEFNQIDRDITYSLQVKFAQMIKELFLGSNITYVKIANVWNESRMQSRQLGGVREGMELGQDIFTNYELDLDIMFDYDNNNAKDFFERMMINDFLLDCNKTYSAEERDNMKKAIIDALFSKDAFNYLVCGSFGIPRVFSEILSFCINAIKNSGEKRIGVNVVCDGVIQQYIFNVRKGIPYSSPLCKSIDEFITKTECRFILVPINEYNKGIHFFDGLVAKNALHQCPSEQVPRKLRNSYKIFYVHYGNYLDALRYNSKNRKLNFWTKIQNDKLYPEFPEDLEVSTDKYVLEIPYDAYDEIYCMNCHKSYKKELDTNNIYKVKCPACNNVIMYWM